MKSFYTRIVQDLKNYNQTFDHNSLLINQPWALVDGDQEIQKLIFKKDKELIISKNGSAIKGSWEYLPEARSIFINRGSDSILYNEAFLSKAVLILKKDGTENDFFVLANENIIPDLDAIKYLRSLRSKILGITYGYLNDGRIFEIHKKCYEGFNLGDNVMIEYDPAPDGIYSIEDSNKKFFVENEKLVKVIHRNKYQTKAGMDIYIEQVNHNGIKKGDPVYIGNSSAPDGKYRLGGMIIIVEKGRIKKKPWF